MQADGGTLFLDEIGDMPLALQARLLRVLQERNVVPLGSGRASPVDLSIICATHRKLRDLVAQGHVPRRPLLPAERPDGDAAAAARAQRSACAGAAHPRQRVVDSTRT
jgi:hypothetical protein